MYEEEKQNIHRFMQEEAAFRALQESSSDPEIEAILVRHKDNLVKTCIIFT
jgi:hypothetical protein